eukprot:365083-Chlamydomonas_euryale.AAC.9
MHDSATARGLVSPGVAAGTRMAGGSGGATSRARLASLAANAAGGNASGRGSGSGRASDSGCLRPSDGGCTATGATATVAAAAAVAATAAGQGLLLSPRSNDGGHGRSGGNDALMRSAWRAVCYDRMRGWDIVQSVLAWLQVRCCGVACAAGRLCGRCWHGCRCGAAVLHARLGDCAVGAGMAACAVLRCCMSGVAGVEARCCVSGMARPVAQFCISGFACAVARSRLTKCRELGEAVLHAGYCECRDAVLHAGCCGCNNAMLHARCCEGSDAVLHAGCCCGVAGATMRRCMVGLAPELVAIGEKFYILAQAHSKHTASAGTDAHNIQACTQSEAKHPSFCTVELSQWSPTMRIRAGGLGPHCKQTSAPAQVCDPRSWVVLTSPHRRRRRRRRRTQDHGSPANVSGAAHRLQMRVALRYLDAGTQHPPRPGVPVGPWRRAAIRLNGVPSLMALCDNTSGDVQELALSVLGNLACGDADAKVALLVRLVWRRSGRGRGARHVPQMWNKRMLGCGRPMASWSLYLGEKRGGEVGCAWHHTSFYSKTLNPKP